MNNQNSSPTVGLPAGAAKGTVNTILVIALLAVIVWQWTHFIAFFVNALVWIYTLVGNNFGLAIIIFTILIRVITWPLNAQQMKGAQAMQELQNDKEWQAIQKKYEKDREKLAQEQMRIYQERGISPFASCLPTLIQFPILISLYQSVSRALANTPLSLLDFSRSIYSVLDVSKLVPLNRQFLWMDLGRPEGIPLPFDISFLPNGFPLLALVVAATTYLQAKLTMPQSTNPNDPNAAVSSQMAIMMPVMLGWFALTFPSGVAVYFITSNLLGIIQYTMQGKANWSTLFGGGKNDADKNKKTTSKK
jgi:YidC/Oxa1 family membrane protein insertase